MNKCKRTQNYSRLCSGKLSYLLFLILHSPGGLLSSSERVVLGKNWSPRATGLAGISNPASDLVKPDHQSLTTESVTPYEENQSCRMHQ